MSTTLKLRSDAAYPLRGDYGGEVAGLAAAFVFGVAALLRTGTGLAVVAGPPLVVLATGSVVRVLAASAAGETDPPRFDASPGLVGDGLRAAVVLAVYAVVPVGIVTGATALLVRLAEAGVSRGDPLALAITTAVLFAVGTVAYVLPAGLTRTATRGRLRAGFGKAVLRAVGHAEYFVAWMVSAVALALTAGVCWVLLSAGGVAGATLAIPLFVYVTVACSHVVGRVTGEALGRDAGPPT